MLAHADMDRHAGRAKREARRERLCVAHARGQAGRRADPLRGRARTGRSFPISSGACPAAACGSRRPARAVDEAVKRKAFARGFKREVRAAADLGARGRAAAGTRGARCARHRPQGRAGRDRLWPKTEAALADDPVAAVLQRLRWRPPTGRARSRPPRRGAKSAENAGEIPVIAAFTSAQLDLALGRSNVVHAALLAGPASNGFLARCQSLERFRTIDPGGRGRDSARLSFDMRLRAGSRIGM